MEKLVKICLAFLVLLVFGIFYIGLSDVNIGSYKEESTSKLSVERLSIIHSQQFPDATPWETCEQEIE